MIIALCALTLLLKSLIFAPISWWPLAFVCLVPWAIAVGASRLAPRVYLYSYVLGFAFFLINMHWMAVVTREGYVALCAYMAVYFPLTAVVLRHMVRRRRWPLALTLPLIWVGNEIVRAVFMSGFPWFFLSHSLHGVQSLIQISDLVGAYGVSFLVAAVNGAIADGVFAWLAARAGAAPTAARPVMRLGLAATAALLIGTFIYGQIQLHRDTMKEGPSIAVLQGDFPNFVNGDETPDEVKRETYFSMMQAASEQRPDLYLLPETPWIMYLNRDTRDFFPAFRRDFNRFQSFAQKLGAYVVTGSTSREDTPGDLLAKERCFNSAMVFKPDGSQPGRYDKVHLVYFGEMIPFRFGRLRFLYLWLNRLNPFSDGGKREFSFFCGSGFHRFEMQAAARPDRPYRFGIPICYEDVMPYISREFVSGGHPQKQVDFLLNISNDGWFGRGRQQPQHLAICVYRAVENRVGIARAVNTGVSAFIDPDGRVHDVVSGDPLKRWPDACGFAVSKVMVDSRYSLYSRYGDWFAWGCAVIWLIFFVDYWVARARVREWESHTAQA